MFWHRHGSGARDAIVPVTADMRLSFRSEVGAGAVVTIRTRIGRIGTKSVQVRFELVGGRDGSLHATCETVEVFFDRTSRESAPIPEVVRNSLTIAATTQMSREPESASLL